MPAKANNDTNVTNGASNTVDPVGADNTDDLNKEIGKNGGHNTVPIPTNTGAGTSTNQPVLDPGTTDDEAENVNNGATTPQEVANNYANAGHNQATSDTPCSCPPDPAKQNPNTPLTPSGNGLDHYGDQNPDPVADPPGTWTSPPPTFTPPEHTFTPCPHGVDCSQVPRGWFEAI